MPLWRKFHLASSSAVRTADAHLQGRSLTDANIAVCRSDLSAVLEAALRCTVRTLLNVTSLRAQGGRGRGAAAGDGCHDAGDRPAGAPARHTGPAGSAQAGPERQNMQYGQCRCTCGTSLCLHCSSVIGIRVWQVQCSPIRESAVVAQRQQRLIELSNMCRRRAQRRPSRTSCSARSGAASVRRYIESLDAALVASSASCSGQTF